MADLVSPAKSVGLILAHRLDAQLVRAVSSLSWCESVLVGWAGSTSVQQVERFLHDVPITVSVLKIDEVTDFSAARNMLLSQVPDRWTFFLDSDESILPTDMSSFAEEVAHCISDHPTSVGLARRKDVFYGKTLQYGEVGNVWVQRLLPPGAMFERSVHEVVGGSHQEFRFSAPLYHHAHESISTFLQKIRLYSELDAKHRIATGEQFRVWQFLLPLGKFVQNYVFKLGMLDGWQGLVYASIMSLHSLSVRCVHFELTQKGAHD